MVAHSPTSFQRHNTNYIRRDGIIHNIYAGNQTVPTLKKTLKEVSTLTTKLRSQKKRVLVLTDIRNLGNLNLQARRFAVDFIRQIDFDKVAIFGNPSNIIERAVMYIIVAAGHGFNMKYFRNEKEAKEWLLE